MRLSDACPLLKCANSIYGKSITLVLILDRLLELETQIAAASTFRRFCGLSRLLVSLASSTKMTAKPEKKKGLFGFGSSKKSKKCVCRRFTRVFLTTLFLQKILHL